MAVKEKTFDCVKFKDEMQRKMRERYAGLTSEESRKRMLENVENGSFGDFWRRISKKKSENQHL